MGELIPFPAPKKRWAGIRKVYGTVVMDPFAHMIDVDEFITGLIEVSPDGEHLSDQAFYDHCVHNNLEADTSFEIYEALSLNGIFIFT